MSKESIQNFTTLQSQIWHSVTNAVSEAVGTQVGFGNFQTDFVASSALFAETAEPKVVVLFSFSDLPQSTQALLVPPDAVLALAANAKGIEVKEIGDALVGELRPVFESFVQGICLAIGQLHGAAVVASGLSIRFNAFVFPPNMHDAEGVFSTSVEMSCEEFKGRISWIADPDTVRMILGLEEEDEDASNGSARKSTAGTEESLEILMDIPLLISVELGRVKMIVKDVVELGSGSIIEIDKAAGEPVDVLVNGKVVARGEVVVIEDNFGVRITEILSQQDRLSKLKEAA